MIVAGHTLVLCQKTHFQNCYYWLKDNELQMIKVDHWYEQGYFKTEREAKEALLYHLSLTEKDLFDRDYTSKLEDIINEDN